MQATRIEEPFQPITVTLTIESKREMELLQYAVRRISRGCIDESHTFEQRDALLNLVEIVCSAACDEA